MFQLKMCDTIGACIGSMAFLSRLCHKCLACWSSLCSALLCLGGCIVLMGQERVLIWKCPGHKAAFDQPLAQKKAPCMQSTLQEAITMCSCKAMHDPYELQHFFMARMEEGRRISKQKKPQPEAMAEMMANVLVWLSPCCMAQPQAFVHHPKASSWSNARPRPEAMSHLMSGVLCMAHTMLQCMTLEHNPCISPCCMTLSQNSVLNQKPMSWYGQH